MNYTASFGFAQKVDPIRNESASTGNAGALARYEREARNSYSVKTVAIERAAHAPAGEGARAPSISLSSAFLSNASELYYLQTTGTRK